MFDEQQKETQKKTPLPKDKPLTNPGSIKGKIDIHDTRERRDGPGGN